MEQKEYNEFIKRLIVKEKNDEPLSFRKASVLSSYKQSQKPKLDFSGVKVIKNDKYDYDEERWFKKIAEVEFLFEYIEDDAWEIGHIIFR